MWESCNEQRLKKAEIKSISLMTEKSFGSILLIDYLNGKKERVELKNANLDEIEIAVENKIKEAIRNTALGQRKDKLNKIENE